ncbi:HAD-IA family hydrolase [Gracilibacillus oryzae]|uniref:HAD-IA family hydrolase n=1 Tax=Gracilibacillus oryzae TaxID=1672701 RepID=A0A7C8GWF7_9BACI|nr:HAD-IA family hydrolase [Gracilibacillus oryzae]KAB8138964.1 HAD-IA family hydrolase [Gracilibacillus oryzae]
MNKTQLVLDIGGVLATDLDDFWYTLSNEARLPLEEVRSIYKVEIRQDLWRGNITEPEFWTWLTTTFPKINEDYLKECLMNCLTPLEAINYLNRWASNADIHILSNHRAEWIYPLLQPFKHLLSSITISSEAGVGKPDKRIYKLCMDQIGDKHPVIFVDNKMENLVPARKIGWQTILADSSNQ